MRDVLVIGGGPAGSTVATLLAKAGHDVLLLEADEHPRVHVGESLLPGITPILQEMGALDAVEAAGFGLKTGTTHWQWGTTPSWDLWFSDTDQYDHSWLVDRARFDELLFSTAKQAGAEVWEHAAARDVLVDGDRVVGAKVRRKGVDEQLEIHARLVIDASGQAALMAKRERLRQHIDGLSHQASWAHFADAGRLPSPRQNQALFVAEQGYWLWLFPFPEGRASVGMVRLDADERPTTRDQVFEDGVKHSAAFMEVLGGAARRVTPIRHQRDFSYRLASVSGPGWLAVGDASGFVDPVLSTGVFLAMHAARDAATTCDRILRGIASEQEAREQYSRHHRELFGDLLRMVRFYYQQNLSRDDYFWESKRILLREDTQLKPQKAFLILTSGLVRNLALGDATTEVLDRRLAASRRDGTPLLEQHGASSIPTKLGFLCVHLRYDDGSDKPAHLYLLVEPRDESAPSLFRTRNYDVNCLAPRYDNDPISQPSLEPTLRELYRGIAALDDEPSADLARLCREHGGALRQLLERLPERFSVQRVFGE
ncbi:MAG: NAD(P)/FAD-dependent oxidoreductase [Polyangiaceae bacterium]